MCFDNELAHLNPLPVSQRKKSFSQCSCKQYSAVHSPQTEHKFGFPTTFLNSPVCFFLCFVKFELSANDIEQTEQTCGLFGLWIFRCRLRILFSANRLWQNSQANFKFFMSSDASCCSSSNICGSFCVCWSCESVSIGSVNSLSSASSSVWKSNSVTASSAVRIIFCVFDALSSLE